MYRLHVYTVCGLWVFSSSRFSFGLPVFTGEPIVLEYYYSHGRQLTDRERQRQRQQQLHDIRGEMFHCQRHQTFPEQQQVRARGWCVYFARTMQLLIYTHSRACMRGCLYNRTHEHMQRRMLCGVREGSQMQRVDPQQKKRRYLRRCGWFEPWWTCYLRKGRMLCG